jgi:hypothetical protein
MAQNDKDQADLAREVERLKLKVSVLEAARPHASIRRGGLTLTPALAPWLADVAMAAPDLSNSIPFKSCDNFLENTTQGRVTKTVTICNDESFEMMVDIEGTKVTTIDPEKCKTIIVQLEKGKALHADHDGRYRIEPS